MSDDTVRKTIFSGVLMAALLVGTVGCGNAWKAETTGKTTEMTGKAEITEEVEIAGESGSIERETINKLEQIQEVVRENFYYEVESPKEQEGILRGYMEALKDPYSVYYTAEEYERILEEQEGEYIYIGAGVEFYPYANEMTALKVYAPAAEKGIREWDVLTEIDGRRIGIEDLCADEDILAGEEGTEVTVTVFRPSDDREYTVTLQRQRLMMPTVEYRMLDHQIGYIRVSHFREQTGEEFRKALVYLNAQEMEGLIVDIRNNGGGTMTAACRMLDYLLPEDKLIYGIDRDGEVVREYKSMIAYQFDKPLAVLVNGYSASASEFFAGAIRDYEVGTIIGENTYGKGIGQQFFPLEDGSAVKLTTFEFVTPKGNRIHSVGIRPDVEVKLEVEACRESGGEQDNQLQAALEAIRSKTEE